MERREAANDAQHMDATALPGFNWLLHRQLLAVTWVHCHVIWELLGLALCALKATDFWPFLTAVPALTSLLQQRVERRTVQCMCRFILAPLAFFTMTPPKQSFTLSGQTLLHLSVHMFLC